MLKLILIGLLMRGDNHGYNLRKIIDDELSTLINVDNTSIYYTLNKMEKEGIVTYSTVSDSKRPQKNLYSITEKGRRVFKEMLLANMSNNKRPLLNIDISLYFIDLLEKEEAAIKLNEREKELRKLIFILRSQEKVSQKKEPKGKETVILSHNRRLAETELLFLKDVSKSLK